jgi:signal transduction histidine kinase
VDDIKVGVLSGDPAFVDSILQSWRGWHFAPVYTVAGNAGHLARHEVILCDGVLTPSHWPSGAILALVIAPEETPANGDAVFTKERQASGVRVVTIPRRTGWSDLAGELVQETVLRVQAQALAAEMKQRLREAERFATLGRFITEARHGLGNALTGVLGNSELLLLRGEEELHGQARAQVETIRQMSLRLHEMFHRLCSLDTELKRQAQQDTAAPVH